MQQVEIGKPDNGEQDRAIEPLAAKATIHQILISSPKMKGKYAVRKVLNIWNPDFQVNIPFSPFPSRIPDLNVW